MLTDDECKLIIKSASTHCGVNPVDVANRLLDEDDKNHLRQCRIDKRDLINAIIVWRDNGMPDYAHGKDVPMKYEK